MIRINGKRVNRKQALEWIKNPKTTITRVSMDWARNEEEKKRASTNEGVTIHKSYLSALSRKMDECNADYARVSLTRVGKLLDKDVLIIVRKGPEPWLERVLRRWNLIS